MIIAVMVIGIVGWCIYGNGLFLATAILGGLILGGVILNMIYEVIKEL